MPIDGDDGFFPMTGNELKPEVIKSNRKYRVRVLVCAPSNSALDEIVLRVLTRGIQDEKGSYNPKIVRIGLKPHHSVQAVAMDYLVEQKLSAINNTTADAKKRGATGDRDSIRALVLEEAAIVFSTLSFSGSSLFSKLNHMFDVVIIDEAAQAVEPATLVPLGNGCKQVFLVGDPVQLPATVISPTAERFGYGMSLFKRFQKAGYPVQMLKTQYRMHPEIRYFPSHEFYNGELEDGPGVKEQTEKPWHGFQCFRPFVFFDIADGVESQPSGSGSWVNEAEVEFVLLMYHRLVTNYPVLKSSSELAIISPYRHQVKLFRDRFRHTFGVESDKLVDINTVDGFQGREKSVAIFSCVRASEKKGIGFVEDFRRMNVGITRARFSVLVVGSASTLKRDDHWAHLVSRAEDQNCLFKVMKPYAPFFSDENLETLRVKEDETMIKEVESLLEDAENNGVMYPQGEPEQVHADDDGYGDGDDGGDEDQ
ncbi:P-loop containing nucleoside triphosphate hydrolases superfamily protein [Thalictrum thalictroides]|uniref:P-loop containing nucleoside triphosphate hydrolases superfamily protein n=1 Tax=Thalictrum thalictroides TaxID=46969 RepID=A0A7J6XDG5_THATH|nr:P-loop containing nucleoside triphosphate hydrolases superfamily protein [Thalictrum thalictroides]